MAGSDRGYVPIYVALLSLIPTHTHDLTNTVWGEVLYMYASLPLHLPFHCPLQAHDATTATCCGALQTSLTALSEQNIQPAGRQWVGKVGAFASQVGEFGFTQAGMLEQTRTMVDSYISKELVQDIPTGKIVVSACIIVFMCSRAAGQSAGRREEHGKDAIHVAHTQYTSIK